MKAPLPGTLKVNIIKKHGYTTEAGKRIQGIADIRVERPLGDGSAKIQTSETVNYTAISVAVKGTDKFDWEIETYHPV